MSSKSEDIRLMVANVRHKKSDGALYLMTERLAWMPNGRDQFTISHKYSDIKMQKISPEGKPKIQLQIVLHTGDATTFQFVNGDSVDSQLEDRRNVKDALLTLLPQFKGKIPKDRERKAKILGENPHLLQLYKDLVEVKVITADEFWQQFASDKDPTTSNGAQFENCTSQQIGISPGFLADIKPQSSLDGSLRYNVNVETLQAIFRTYPNVAKKHRECVPTKMTESEFWSKFFQSQYFHRDRIGSIKDMFSDCSKMDDKDWSKAVKAGVNDPYLDLSAFDDNPYTSEGYGNNSGVDDNQSGGKKDQSIAESANHALIKSFNQHSIKVLESCLHKEKKTSSPPTTTNDTSKQKDTENGSAAKQALANEEPEATFRSKRRQWNYQDLEDDNVQRTTSSHSHSSRLNLSSKEIYSIAPACSDETSVSSSVIVQRHLEQITKWSPKLSECISSEEAVKALGELSPTGLLMRTINIDRLSDSVAEEVQESLKSTYYASNELLRHFWLCFPVIGQNLEKKLEKMDETLTKFEMTKLQPFKQRLARDQDNLINHILIQFNIAHRKYEDWKEKRRRNAAMLRSGQRIG